MTTATIGDNTFTTGIRTFFPAEKRIIQREQNQASYVPTNQLPEEIVVTITSDTIEFDFSYGIKEETSREIIGQTVYADIGKNTGRIFSLTSNFTQGSYSAMLRRLDAIEDSIIQLKKRATGQSIKKSYDLILQIIEALQERVKAQHLEIKKVLAPDSGE